MKKVGVIGASGYAGVELVKLLERHGRVELLFANSRSLAGKKVKNLDKAVKTETKFTNFSIAEINSMKPDIVFLATPEQAAREIVPQLRSRIIDLSYDFRFSQEAVYGLPELFREKIKTARIVSNPGCYATASLLSLLPVQSHAKQAILDCKSGYSGAGREKKYVNDPVHYANNIISYDITRHRHVAEIQQFVKTKISFTPHVIPTFRGLMCTAHILLKQKGMAKEKAKALYTEMYRKEPFVKIVEKLPELHDAQNTNFFCIGGFEIDNHNRLVVVATVDNLLKGASGQAVQNMNLMLGFRETTGLL